MATNNTPAVSAALNVAVAIAAPSTPDLLSLSDTGAFNTDNITSDNTPTFTGTGINGATVTLGDGRTNVGTDIVVDGKWSITVTTAIPDGLHALIASQVDTAGNSSSASDAVNFIVDTGKPAVPTIGAIGGGDKLVSTQLGDAVVSGTAEANGTVVIFSGATKLGTAATDGAGKWSYTLSAANIAVLGQGAGKIITATASDLAGNQSAATAPFTFAVDTVVPPPSGLAMAPASDSGVQGDRITNVSTPTFTGAGETGDTVTLHDGSTTIGTGKVIGGTWSIIASTLVEGANAITATETDGAGNISASTAALNVLLDSKPPAVMQAASSPSNAILGAGVVVSLGLGFNEAVTIAGGTPTLTLNNGGTATFVSGSGTSALLFTYAVGGGQDVADLAITAVNLNGATATDRAGNAADLTRAAVNPTGTLAIEPGAIAAFDTTTGQPVAVVGQAYTGPVAGLQSEYVNITSDNLSVATGTPNWFIHSGSGDDAIAVSSGTNVLDGGTGSNFLTGGNGTDTFFVDDRVATADIWSTVVGFHAGDAATIWGVTPQDFTLTSVNGQGAAGFIGLTLRASAAGKPTASLTLAGYSQADLSSGRISVQFGTDQASGSAFMFVHGNS